MELGGQKKQERCWWGQGTLQWFQSGISRPTISTSPTESLSLNWGLTTCMLETFQLIWKFCGVWASHFGRFSRCRAWALGWRALVIVSHGHKILVKVINAIKAYFTKVSNSHQGLMSPWKLFEIGGNERTWDHEISPWKYLKTCSPVSLEHRVPHSPPWTSFRAYWGSTAAAAQNSVSALEGGKCSWQMPICSW